MTTWDDVCPLLCMITREATRASNAAAIASTAAFQLPAKPDFDTRAAESLSKAEAQLRVALSAVKAARERFENVPVEKLPIFEQAAE
jgi:hypothetical protein